MDREGSVAPSRKGEQRLSQYGLHGKLKADGTGARGVALRAARTEAACSQRPVTDLRAPCSSPFRFSLSVPVPDPAVLGTAWVTEETETSLDVEWENPLTEVDYYKLQYGPLTGHEVDEVTVPKSSEPKSRYDITGKGCQGAGRRLPGMLGGDSVPESPGASDIDP